MTRRPGPSNSNGALAAMGMAPAQPSGSGGVILNIRKVGGSY